MDIQRDYYQPQAAAYVRGRLQANLGTTYPWLFEPDLVELSEDDLQQLVELGEQQELRLHRFKRSMVLPRVQRVLGMLKGLQPVNMLDIGTGRGVFLWPMLEAFPGLPMTCVDQLDFRARDLQAVGAGGLSQLTALQGDVTALPFADRSFDVVTMLEVLEHVPDTRKALAEVCRVANRALILSVPSQADDNPEHIHLFSQADLRAFLAEQGVKRLNFSYVLNHMLVFAHRESA